MDHLLWGLLGYACLPAWLVAGLVDCWAHQRTDLDHTTGTSESLLHVAQALQIGVPLLLLLFLELNLLTLAIVAGCALIHTGTAYWDLRYSSPRRRILPAEQMAHSFLIALPLFATAVLALLQWPVVMAATGDALAPQGAWSLQLRREPWPPGLVTLVLAASLSFGLVPALAELRKSARAGTGPTAQGGSDPSRGPDTAPH
jgi:hypothetical protein